MPVKGTRDQYVFVIVLFSIAGFIAYYPILQNTFLSDDYDSLFRICIEKKVIYKEILRPMIDISFYFNYLISGFSPLSYYVFNVTVHIATSFLIFCFSKNLKLFENNDQFVFAFIAGLLFLVYPFHNESIVWLSGRLSSMACFFALLSLILARETKSVFATFLAILFYIIGLLSYESIIILPALIFIFTKDKFPAFNKRVLFTMNWVIPSIIYLLSRYLLSGSIIGSYGEGVIDGMLSQKITNIPKVLGRLLLPPSENGLVLTFGAIIVCVVLFLVHKRSFIKIEANGPAKNRYLALLLSLFITLSVPFAFGISTRTSEGDRLLYFPSVYLCIIIAYWVVILCGNDIYRLIIMFFIVIYSLLFMELNNNNWVKASIVASVIMNAANNKGTNDVLFINMPEEIEGAFVFRNGFKKALTLNHVDTSKVKVFNYLDRLAYLKAQNVISPVYGQNDVVIFPSVRLSFSQDSLISITNEQNKRTITLMKDKSLIYYWDKQTLKKIF